MSKRSRITTTLVALALAVTPAACGEEDLEDAGRQTKDEAGEIKRDAEKKGREAKKDVEKEIRD
jgi:hypothetical protein